MGWILLGAVILSLAVALMIRTGYSENALSAAKYVFTRAPAADSWRPMHDALVAWRENPSGDVYAETFKQGNRFQYPPSALFVAMAADALSPADFTDFYRLPSFLMLLLTIVGADRTLAAAMTSQGLGTSSMRAAALRLGLVAVLCLSYFPIARAANLGQVQLWLDAFFALALWRWIAGDRVTPGVLIALTCLIKPQLSVFFLWALLRREWRFAATLAAVGGLGLVASLATFGLATHLGYFDVLSFLAERGESFRANQSVNGVLNRIMSLSQPDLFNNLEWVDRHFPPYSPLVRIGTLVSSLGIMALALWPRSRPRDADRSLDFCTLALSCTIASPVAWEHHYGLAFPMFALAAVVLRERPAWLLALAVSYLATGQYIEATDRLAATPFNVLQSYVLLGGLLLLAILHLAPPAAPQEAPGRPESQGQGQ
jgi:hypothetical protein